MTPLSPTLSKLPLIFCGSPFSSLVTNCSSTVSSIQSLSFTRPPLLSTLVPGDGNSSVDQQPQSQRQRGRQKSCAEKDPRHDTAAVPLQHSEVAPDQQHLDHEPPTTTCNVFMSMLTLRTLVARLALVRIRWVVIPDCALTPPLMPPRTRPRLGGVLHCRTHTLEPALLPAGHDDGDAVTHHRAVGREARYRQRADK